MMTRRSYSKEYKLEAIRLSEATGNTSKTARDLGIRAEMIRRWRLQFNDHGRRAFPGHGMPRDEEFAELRRENKRLIEANIVLQKVAGLFGRDLR